MLPPYIIEQIREREEAMRREQARPQPRLEIPLPVLPHPASPPEEAEERGVFIIQVG